MLTMTTKPSITPTNNNTTSPPVQFFDDDLLSPRQQQQQRLLAAPRQPVQRTGTASTTRSILKVPSRSCSNSSACSSVSSVSGCASMDGTERFFGKDIDGLKKALSSSSNPVASSYARTSHTNAVRVKSLPRDEVDSHNNSSQPVISIRQEARKVVSFNDLSRWDSHGSDLNLQNAKRLVSTKREKRRERRRRRSPTTSTSSSGNKHNKSWNQLILDNSSSSRIPAIVGSEFQNDTSGSSQANFVWEPNNSSSRRSGNKKISMASLREQLLANKKDKETTMDGSKANHLEMDGSLPIQALSSNRKNRSVNDLDRLSASEPVLLRSAPFRTQRSREIQYNSNIRTEQKKDDTMMDVSLPVQALTSTMRRCHLSANDLDRLSASEPVLLRSSPFPTTRRRRIPIDQQNDAPEEVLPIIKKKQSRNVKTMDDGSLPVVSSMRRCHLSANDLDRLSASESTLFRSSPFPSRRRTRIMKNNRGILDDQSLQIESLRLSSDRRKARRNLTNEHLLLSGSEPQLATSQTFRRCHTADGLSLKKNNNNNPTRSTLKPHPLLPRQTHRANNTYTIDPHHASTALAQATMLQLNAPKKSLLAMAHNNNNDPLGGSEPTSLPSSHSQPFLLRRQNLTDKNYHPLPRRHHRGEEEEDSKNVLQVPKSPLRSNGIPREISIDLSNCTGNQRRQGVNSCHDLVGRWANHGSESNLLNAKQATRKSDDKPPTTPRRRAGNDRVRKAQTLASLTTGDNNVTTRNRGHSNAVWETKKINSLTTNGGTDYLHTKTGINCQPSSLLGHSTLMQRLQAHSGKATTATAKVAADSPLIKPFRRTSVEPPKVGNTKNPFESQVHDFFVKVSRELRDENGGK